ncbi:hypothetical protein BKA70DRAFT_1568301, partial [Coprinopsis sp. MPI-PUGE-AT-0042]
MVAHLLLSVLDPLSFPLLCSYQGPKKTHSAVFSLQIPLTSDCSLSFFFCIVADIYKLFIPVLPSAHGKVASPLISVVYSCNVVLSIVRHFMMTIWLWFMFLTFGPSLKR